MIRCIPIDGSESFEVENYHACRLVGGGRLFMDEPCVAEMVGGRAVVNGKVCLIESWRERAERLEWERAEAITAIEERISACGYKADAASSKEARLEAQDRGDGFREALIILRRS